MKFTTTLIFLLGAHTTYASHPAHTTIVNLELNESDKSISYSIRTFQEDIINLLSLLVHEELHKGRQENEIYADSSLIPNYFKQAFRIQTGTPATEPILTKLESNAKEYWLHFKLELTIIPDKLFLVNKIYSELYRDHVNLVIFSSKDIEKGLTFNSTTTSQSIVLKHTN